MEVMTKPVLFLAIKVEEKTKAHLGDIKQAIVTRFGV